MISIAIAFAPVAAVSLFAAAIPVLAGARRRGAAPGRAHSARLELGGSASDDGDTLSLAVRNRGDGVATVEVSVSVYDATGAERARFDLPAGRLLPGRVLAEELDMVTLPEGRYRAIVAARAGDEWYAAEHAWTRRAAVQARAAA